MNDATPRGTTDAAQLVADGLRYGAREIRRSWWRIGLLFAALLLPLWGFGELAEEIGEGEAIPFDQPLLDWMQALRTPARDALFLFFSRIGYAWGVVPFDVALVLGLAALRRHREGLFAGLALTGSGLLNVAAKHYFGRPRPPLWEAIVTETTFSFPSGHAMGSMTLAAVLVLLAWGSRWRWPLLAVLAVFVAMVGLSRVYLGVHYPSDILAGWAAALAWVVGMYVLLFGGARRPFLRPPARG